MHGCVRARAFVGVCVFLCVRAHEHMCVGGRMGVCVWVCLCVGVFVCGYVCVRV